MFLGLSFLGKGEGQVGERSSAPQTKAAGAHRCTEACTVRNNKPPQLALVVSWFVGGHVVYPEISADRLSTLFTDSPVKECSMGEDRGERCVPGMNGVTGL